MTDLHLHTRLSHDGEDDAENYILAAKARGITCLGFSEHYDYDAYLDGEVQSSPLTDLKAYGKEIAALSEKYPEIKILKGIELGYSEEARTHYRDLLSRENFDYAILSVHTLKDRGDCYFPRFFEGLSKEQAYRAYLNAVLGSVRSGLNFQIVGHLGYIVRYAPYADKRILYAEFGDLLDEILTEIIARDKCLELNTSVKGGQGVTVPNAEIVERYLALGGKNFSLGSDAHSCARLAENFSAVKNFLSFRGVTYVCRYEAGKKIKEKI